MTHQTMIGSQIKAGFSGPMPRVQYVLWQGTAEVLVYGANRVPAALVETSRGLRAVVQLAGIASFEQNQWWDARVTHCRKWETADPATAAKINACLASTDDEHEAVYRRLRRIARTHALTGDDGVVVRCGKSTLCPDDLFVPCVLSAGHDGDCDGGR